MRRRQLRGWKVFKQSELRLDVVLQRNHALKDFFRKLRARSRPTAPDRSLSPEKPSQVAEPLVRGLVFSRLSSCARDVSRSSRPFSTD